jgi:glutaredoxin 3
MRTIIIPICALLVLAETACNDKKAPPPHVEKKAAKLPKVTDDRTDLVLSWYADGGPATASSVSDVPEDAKREVRVQDPTIPPEDRDPETIYLADLTQKTGNGYFVKAVKRSEFEAERQAEREKEQKAKAQAMAAINGAQGAGPRQPSPSSIPKMLNLPPGAAPSVVMYATKHCPVCVKARRWLLEQKIPYVEKDLESDPSAAAEVQKKGQAQGVPTSGVPIFEINGKLLPGFDPAQIVAMLVNASGSQKTI